MSCAAFSYAVRREGYGNDLCGARRTHKSSGKRVLATLLPLLPSGEDQQITRPLLAQVCERLGFFFGECWLAVYSGDNQCQTRKRPSFLHRPLVGLWPKLNASSLAYILLDFAEVHVGF